MSGNFDPRLNGIDTRVNTVVGIKQYRQVKKVMENFDSKLNRELNKALKVDRQIK
jgi:hypothetical protein